MRKILALALPLILLSLMTLQCKAVTTPVEVERLKDICFIRIRGDHHTQSFLFQYESLSPKLVGDEAPPPPRWVKLKYYFTDPDGRDRVDLPGFKSYYVPSGGLIDEVFVEDYGYTLNFKVYVGEPGVPPPEDPEDPQDPPLLVLEDSVFIPPPP